MTFVRFKRGGVLHRPEDDETTFCGISRRGATVVEVGTRMGRCRACERVAAIRTTLTEAWKKNEPVNRMALLRELVEMRAKRRAETGVDG